VYLHRELGVSVIFELCADICQLFVRWRHQLWASLRNWTC